MLKLKKTQNILFRLKFGHNIEERMKIPVMTKKYQELSLHFDKYIKLLVLQSQSNTQYKNH